MPAPDEAWWREPDTGCIHSCQTGRNQWEASYTRALRRNRLHRGRVLGGNVNSCGDFDLELTLFWRVIWGKPKEILAQKLGFVLSLGWWGEYKRHHNFSLIFSFWNFNFLFSFVNLLIGSQKIAKIEQRGPMYLLPSFPQWLHLR